jgi:cyanophycinase
MGFIVLEGGNEFRGLMESADRRAIRLAGGAFAPICVIPAAAAPDKNHLNAGRNGVRWFESLGAKRVQALALIDRPSADDPEIAAELESSRLIFLLGGSPRHLADCLRDSRAWQAMMKAHRRRAVIAGSSAGAMVLCSSYFDPETDQSMPGLNLLPDVCVLPHHDRFSRTWVPRLSGLLPGVLLVGIDEETAMVNDGAGGQWTVYGRGAVTIYGSHGTLTLKPGARFKLPVPIPE